MDLAPCTPPPSALGTLSGNASAPGHVFHARTHALEQPATLTLHTSLIETAQTDGHSSEDASRAPLKTLSLWSVHEEVKGSKGACKDSLVACWRKANAIVGDEWAVKRAPAFTLKQFVDWSNAVRGADVGKATEERLRKQRKRNPVEAQAVNNRRRQEQFKFDFAGLLRIEHTGGDGDGDGDGKGSAPTMSAQSIKSTSGSTISITSASSASPAQTTEAVCKQSVVTSSLCEQPSVNVRLTCVLGGVQLHVRVAGREQLDFSTVEVEKPRRSSAGGLRELQLASVHAVKLEMREAEAGERKRRKDWADVEALREQAAEMQAWKCEAEAKQGRQAAELQARLEQVARLEREKTEAAAAKTAEAAKQKKKKDKQAEKWYAALELKEKQRAEAQEQVVRLQEEMGKEELVRRRVAEENARMQKQRSTFEAASEQAASFFW